MIPNTIYFILFGNKEFSMFNYVAVRSAFEVNKPDKIVLLCDDEPRSEWFKKCKSFVEIKKIVPPNKIFDKPIHHLAHKADVVRLETLIENGGVYFDLDTICLKPLDELRNFDCVMGREFFYWSDDPSEPLQRYYKGLCNAVILAKPNASFLVRWYDTYKSFRSNEMGHYWAEHSVEMPGKLSETFKDEIEVLDEDAFFNPSWDEPGMKNLFVEDCSFPKAYTYHLWEKVAWSEYMSKITLEQIMTKDTTYNRSARKYLNGIG
jgi:hypothetical protein